MNMVVKYEASHATSWAVNYDMLTTGSAIVRASALYSNFVLTRDSTCCGYLASRLRITNKRAGTNTWEDVRSDVSTKHAKRSSGQQGAEHAQLAVHVSSCNLAFASSHAHCKTVVEPAGTPALLYRAPLQELPWMWKLYNRVPVHQLQINRIQSAASLQGHEPASNAGNSHGAIAWLQLILQKAVKSRHL